MWEAAAIFCPELDEAFPNHDAKIRIFSVTAKFQVADKGCFQQRGMEGGREGRGPAMEPQGTGRTNGGRRGGRERKEKREEEEKEREGGEGRAIPVNKAKNIE